MSGKTVLVTGANKGMGYEVALALASRKHKVIMADKQDQSKSRDKIIRESCNENVRAEYLDLASFNSIKGFSKKMQAAEDRLDVLVNNAGVFCMDKQKTVDGFDGVMQTNHLGPFLLTHLLLELFRKTFGSRIIFVTSSGSFFHNMSIEKLKEPDYFEPHYLSGAIHYYNSKLCNMIASKMFARKLLDRKITSNCLHPGMTSTDFLVANAGKLKKSLTKGILRCTCKDVRDAAALTTFLATSDTIKSVSGKYFVDYRVSKEPRIMEDGKFCKNIWNESVKLVGISVQAKEKCRY